MNLAGIFEERIFFFFIIMLTLSIIMIVVVMVMWARLGIAHFNGFYPLGDVDIGDLNVGKQLTCQYWALKSIDQGSNGYTQQLSDRIMMICSYIGVSE